MSASGDRTGRRGRRRSIVRAATLALVALPIGTGAGASGSARAASASVPVSTTATSGTTSLRVFDGIPQDGMTLGRPSAPATLWLANDPQSGSCRRFWERTLPRLVPRVVTSGRARVRLELYPFIGPDSDRGARFVVAAGRQDRAFQAFALLFDAQDEPNSGYLTDDLLRALAVRAGLDVDRVMRDMRSRPVAREVRRQERSTTSRGAVGTPTLFTQRGSRPRRLVADFTSVRAISRQLAGG